MEEKTYTLNIRQTGTWQYEVTIPEIGVMKTAPILDSALTIALNDIVKHLTTRSLILVFADRHVDNGAWSVNPQERPHTDQEYQAAFEVAQRGIDMQIKRRERHLVFELSCPLTRAQTIWFDKHASKFFDKYYIKDELEVELDVLLEKARENRKATAHE